MLFQTQWITLSKISLVMLFMQIIASPIVFAALNPYEILGVRVSATPDQIKKAYRDLARRLHPDRSILDEDEASRRFIELNEAFNILKDPSKRNRYDQSKQTEDNSHSRGYGHTYRSQHPSKESRSDPLYSDARSYFNFGRTSGIRRLVDRSITYIQFRDNYLQESERRPFLIFVYSDLCLTCSMIENGWMDIVEIFARHNVGFFSVNSDQEPKLAKNLDAYAVPHIACLIDGRVYPFYTHGISPQSISKFIGKSLPSNLVSNLLDEHTQERFITQSPSQNRLCAIIVSKERDAKLRYKLLAYEFRQHYRFGHISTKLSQHKYFFNKFNIASNHRDHLLIFDENTKRPFKHLEISTIEFDAALVRNQLSQWPFLLLPRISSQSKFDELCSLPIPRDDYKTGKRLCAVLFVSSTSSSLVRTRMVEFIQANKLQRDKRVVFAYIDPVKQINFIYHLLAETSGHHPPFVSNKIESSVILIERQLEHDRKARYNWLAHRWDPKDLDEIDKAKIELFRIVADYKLGLYQPSNKMALASIVDEESASLIYRIFWRFIGHITRIYYHLTSEESFAALLILVGSACLTTLFLYKSREEAFNSEFAMPEQDFADNDISQNQTNGHRSSSCDVQKTDLDSEGKIETSNQSLFVDELKLILLKAETYNGMVRLLKPGFRSIIVLVDANSKTVLLEHFRKAVWPYRRNKTLLFGYLCLDTNLDWYKTLLERVLGGAELKMNKKNCIGTVLSLNGFKKYFRFYHAKHHETGRFEDDTDNEGSFLGFEENEDDRNKDIEHGFRQSDEVRSQKENKICAVDNLLDWLPIWLDKMFDGLTKRYFIDKWPENIK